MGSSNVRDSFQLHKVKRLSTEAEFSLCLTDEASHKCRMREARNEIFRGFDE